MQKESTTSTIIRSGDKRQANSPANSSANNPVMNAAPNTGMNAGSVSAVPKSLPVISSYVSKTTSSFSRPSRAANQSVIDLRRSQEQIENTMRIREDSVMAVMKSLAALDDFYRSFYGDALSAAGEPVLERYPI